MSTTTTNYGLIKPGTDDPILVGQLNDNMDTIDTVLKDHSDKIDAASLGIKYKGEVNYYADLPNSAEIGDAYTVKYSGTSGTTPDGTEYVWGTVSGTNQWINFSKDSYTKAEVDALLTLKQNALNSAQLDAVNSGITAAKVTSFEGKQDAITSNNKLSADLVNDTATANKFVTATDKTAWNAKQNALTASQLDAVNSGITATDVAQIETNKNNISLLTAKANQIGLKLVKSQTVSRNTEITYTMNMNDFIESSPNIDGSIGTYIISVMPWSTTPIFSLYSVSYTGGSFSYTSIVKIAGADRTVTVSNGIISVSGFPNAGAKVSIHAML